LETGCLASWNPIIQSSIYRLESIRNYWNELPPSWRPFRVLSWNKVRLWTFSWSKWDQTSIDFSKRNK
jgi:hypothetical protein